MRLENSVNRPSGTRPERDLVCELRRLPEDDRFLFIQEVMRHDIVLALRLATVCLRKKSYFEAIFRQGLEIADASGIRFWLECMGSKLGLSRMIEILREELETNPEAVDKALYWLPQYLQKGDVRGSLALHDLRTMAQSRGVIRRPQVSRVR
jgi:hypothetical protein